ncbi:hypothetical protein AAE478_009977 [Parahypoxylon ruwenzoriense]
MNDLYTRAATNSPRGFPVCMRAMRGRLVREQRGRHFPAAIRHIFASRVAGCEVGIEVTPIQIFLWEIYSNLTNRFCTSPILGDRFHPLTIFTTGPGSITIFERPQQMVDGSDLGPVVNIAAFLAVDIDAMPVDNLIDFMWLNGDPPFIWIGEAPADGTPIPLTYMISEQMTAPELGRPYSWVGQHMSTIASLLLEGSLPLPMYLFRRTHDPTVRLEDVPCPLSVLAGILVNTDEGVAAQNAAFNEELAKRENARHRPSSHLTNARGSRGGSTSVRGARGAPSGTHRPRPSPSDRATLEKRDEEKTLNDILEEVVREKREAEAGGPPVVSVIDFEPSLRYVYKVVYCPVGVDDAEPAQGFGAGEDELPLEESLLVPLLSKIVEMTDRIQRRAMEASEAALQDAVAS